MKPFIPSRVAEIVFALVLIIFGINHFRAGDAMAGGVPLPGGVIWVYIVGAGFLLAAIAIVINRFKTLACYLLAFMLLVFVAAIHIPALLNAAEGAGTMPLVSALKDTAMAMGAIIIGNRAGEYYSNNINRKGAY
jgi:putative oxidoreductase